MFRIPMKLMAGLLRVVHVLDRETQRADAHYKHAHGGGEFLTYRQSGFTLLEIICVLAIIAILAAIALPAFPLGTSRARLEGYALETAALLKADRSAAMRRRGEVATVVDAPGRTIRSGASGRVVRIPGDVSVDAMLAARCNNRSVGATIRYFAAGTSCGGVIALRRKGVGYEVRVSWLTGGVEVVPIN
jgi:general secretion pathway protein H